MFLSDRLQSYQSEVLFCGLSPREVLSGDGRRGMLLQCVLELCFSPKSTEALGDDVLGKPHWNDLIQVGMSAVGSYNRVWLKTNHEATHLIWRRTGITLELELSGKERCIKPCSSERGSSSQLCSVIAGVDGRERCWCSLGSLPVFGFQIRETPESWVQFPEEPPYP